LVPGASYNIGTGRLGDLIEPVTLLGLAQRLAKVLPATATGVRVAGNHESAIKRIALCGGAGDAFIEQAYDSGADVYITSDLRHHPVQEAREKALAQNRSMAFIDVSHWAAEWIWLQGAAETLSRLHPSIEFKVCELRTDPWDFVVTQ
jgi:putative NIF3 family GTP cyclohydrolase 1 type 2